jgi:hypothetical protein
LKLHLLKGYHLLCNIYLSIYYTYYLIL